MNGTGEDSRAKFASFTKKENILMVICQIGISNETDFTIESLKFLFSTILKVGSNV